MTILETIIEELSSAPEALLLQVYNFIKVAKEEPNLPSNSSILPRTAGLHQGEIWMSDDFNEPLPDEFWLGEEE